MEKREVTIKIRLSESELAMIRDKMDAYGTDNIPVDAFECVSHV